MTGKRHGLSIGIERTGSDVFLALKPVGKLTHDDYEIITPMIDSALAEVRQPKVKVLIDGTEFEGWDLRAAWDDFRLGLRHNNDFHRIAIYGNRRWQEIAARVGAWFASGEVKYFDDEDDALAWLNG